MPPAHKWQLRDSRQRRLPVSIDGHDVLRIYEGLGSFSAADRAQKGGERLRKLAESDENIDSLTTEDQPFGTELVLGDQILMVVTDGEARHTGLPRQMLAKQYVDRVKEVVRQVRLEHSKQYLLKAVIVRANHPRRLLPADLAHHRRHSTLAA